MKLIKTLLLIILIFVIQIAIVPNITISSAFPNILLISAVVLLLNFEFDKALIWAGIGGIMMDIYSPLHFGVYTFGFLIIWFIANFIFKRYISEQLFPIVIVSFFIAYLLVEFIPFITKNGSYMIYFSSAVYTAILGTIIYYLLTHKFEKRQSTYKLSNKL